MSDINEDLLPIVIDPAATSFVANGHTYYVEHNARLSVARDRWLEKFGMMAITGRDGRAVMTEIRRAYDALNSGKAIDCGVILDNVLAGVADMIARESPLMYICTLFINREGEDRREYDVEFAKQKLSDWQDIEAFFFKKLAISYLSITGNQLSMFMQTSLGATLPKMDLKNS